jgi:hypothetical protein
MINEHVLESLAAYSHPRQIVVLLLKEKNSRGAFNRVRRTVFGNIFTRFRRSLPNLLQKTSVQSFFEDFLPRHAYTPRIPCDQMNNSCFLYQNEHGEVTNEWLCASVEIMRLYWDGLIQSQHKPQAFTAACQDIILLLPGQKTTCQQCEWVVPETAMYDDQQCAYCRCKQLGHGLHMTATGVPIIA